MPRARYQRTGLEQSDQLLIRRLRDMIWWLRVCCVDTYRHRHLYRSVVDVARTFELRLSATQVGRRWLPTGECLVRLRNSPDPLILRRGTSDMLVLRDIYERREYARAADLIAGTGSKVIIDLGGNTGLTSLWFADRFPDATLLVVEPDDANYRLLRKNCRRLIKNGRVRTVRAFAAAEPGFAEVDREAKEAWSFKKGDARQPEFKGSVLCMSVQQLLGLLGTPRVDLLKCDVEGSERELFQSCGRWIGGVRRLVVETHPPYMPTDLYADLTRSGWTFAVVEEHGYPTTVCTLVARDEFKD